MKKLWVFALVAIGALAVLSGCLAKDGIQGPPGQDGTDGRDGDAAIASCMKCHTDSNFRIKDVQYRFSKHFVGTTSARNSRFCVRCHTNEGFQEVAWDDLPWGRAEIPTSTRIQCQTCHKMSSFETLTDSIASINSILRTTEPVILNYLNAATLTGWTTKNVVDNSQGRSKVNNLCVSCHQIRGNTSYQYTDTGATGATRAFTQLAYFPMGTAILPGDTATVAKGNLKGPTDSVAYMEARSFSVHDGNQSNLFYGRYGYDFGTPITTAARHHANDDCTVCHMNEWDSVTHKGGHSLIMNEEDVACNACHNLKDTLALTQANIDALRIQLAEAMVARKMMKKATNATTGVVTYTLLTTHDFFGRLYSTNLADSAVLYARLQNANKVDTATGNVTYINRVVYTRDADLRNRIGRKWKYGELGAAYNYGFINSEFSRGAHNDEYARKLLQASINWLAANP